MLDYVYQNKDQLVIGLLTSAGLKGPEGLDMSMDLRQIEVISWSLFAADSVHCLPLFRYKTDLTSVYVRLESKQSTLFAPV